MTALVMKAVQDRAAARNVAMAPGMTTGLEMGTALDVGMGKRTAAFLSAVRAIHQATRTRRTGRG
jgi:hypothetical protein